MGIRLLRRVERGIPVLVLLRLGWAALSYESIALLHSAIECLPTLSSRPILPAINAQLTVSIQAPFLFRQAVEGPLTDTSPLVGIPMRI